MTAVSGPLAALLTPRTDSGGINFEALERNVEFVLERGVRGVVPCGGTGENFDLSVDQRKEAIERLAPALRGRGLLIPGIGAGTLGESIDLGRHALESGADAVLLPAPHFYRYDGRDLVGFYRQAARAIGGPLLVYNLAAFVSPVPNEVAIELLETEDNIVGVKDSSGDLDLLEAMTKRGDAAKARILGHDVVLGDALRAGLLDAVISGPASVIPEATSALFELAGNEDSFEKAADLYAEFVRHNEQLPYPWGLKHIAESRGLFRARLPFEPSDDRRQQISAYLRWFEEWLERVQQCRSGAALACVPQHVASESLGVLRARLMSVMRSRRDVVKLLGFPAIVPASVLGQDAPSNKMSIAFIGTGNNGTNWMRLFLKDKRVRVRAVCDVNREGAGYWSGTVRGRELARRLVDEHYGDNSCLAFEDFRQVVSRDDIDAIYCGTPDHWHALIAIAAAKAGKDTYGQKPLSLTVAEGRAMVSAVDTAGIVWQTGSQQRSDRNFRRVCELARNGRLGKIHTVRVGLPPGIPDYGKTAHQTDAAPVPNGFNYDMWLGPAPEKPFAPARVGVNFRWVFDYSGGQVTVWGGHHLDIAQWGLGMDHSGPIAIRAAHGTFAKHPIYNTATNFYFEAEYANVTRLICSDKERSGVTFHGSDGWAWANRGVHEASSADLLTQPLGSGEERLYRSENHVTNFVDCFFSRNKTVAPIEAAHRSVSIAHLANIAMRKGRGFRWDPVAEEILNDPGANEMLSRPYRGRWRLS